MTSRIAGLRASGKGAASTTRPTRISTLRKSSKPICGAGSPLTKDAPRPHRSARRPAVGVDRRRSTKRQARSNLIATRSASRSRRSSSAMVRARPASSSRRQIARTRRQMQRQRLRADRARQAAGGDAGAGQHPGHRPRGESGSAQARGADRGGPRRGGCATASRCGPKRLDAAKRTSNSRSRGASSARSASSPSSTRASMRANESHENGEPAVEMLPRCPAQRNIGGRRDRLQRHVLPAPSRGERPSPRRSIRSCMIRSSTRPSSP